MLCDQLRFSDALHYFENLSQIKNESDKDGILVFNQ